MRSLRGWKLPVALLGGLLVLFLVYAAWLVFRTAADLSSAADDAATLRDAVESGDDAAAQDALANLKESAASAAGRTDGPAWSVLTWTPVVGDDFDGIRTVSTVLDDLARSGIEPLVQTSQQLDGLRPVDGQIDLAALAALQQPVADGNEAFARASDRLAEHDSSGYVGPLRSQYDEATREIAQAAGLLGSADRALQVMPSMLGADGPRSYLLIFQNNAEIRGGGGLPGSASLVTATDGRIEMTRQVAGSSFGQAAEPVLPLTDAEEEIWDRQLGTYFLDANFTPDFPRSAALWRARWEQEYEPIDGVLAIDPVTLSYLLGAIGSVEVEGGPTLTTDNVVDEFLHEVYLRYDDPAAQDAYFQRAARTIFDSFAAGNGNSRRAIEALARGTAEGRVKVHSFVEEDQAVLAGTAIAGELVHDESETAPQVGVYLNDTTGAKMSYFLRHEVHVTATSCSGGVQGLSGRAFLLSEAPADAASLPDYVTGAGRYGIEPGAQLVSINIVGPVGGTIENVTYNDEPVLTVRSVDLNGRPVLTIATELQPGETSDVKWTMRTGPGQIDDAVVATTPGVLPENYRSTAHTAC